MKQSGDSRWQVWDFYGLGLFSQIYFSYFSEELLLPAPHNMLRIQKLWGTDVLWSFEISLQPDCMSVWEMGCHERKECMQRPAHGMCSEDGSVYFNSSASFSGIWSEDLWFSYSLCSLYYSLDFGAQFSLLLFWLSWAIPVLFLGVSNVCILGFLDFSLRRGKFFPSVCLSSLFNLSLQVLKILLQ